MEQNCKGCKAIQGTVFWGKCDIYTCCKESELEHCGRCLSFPCDMLQEWAVSENPERIENLKILNKNANSYET